MCGIVGCVGTIEAQPFLLKGLAALEYRGYDSAGFAIARDGRIEVLRRTGKVSALAEAASQSPVSGTCGIAHTRWATHGVPEERNAHPHRDCSGRIAVVHNGIIENYVSLKEELAGRGHVFTSDTDSEVVAHLVEEAYQGDLLEAVRIAALRLTGSFAIAVISADHPDQLVVARRNSPIVVAQTEVGCMAASDPTALLGYTRDVVTLDAGQLADLHEDGTLRVIEADGTPCRPQYMHIGWDVSAATLGEYPDFMLKEICEQPQAIERLLRGRLHDGRIKIDELSISDEDLVALDRVFIVACGTSYHAGLIAKSLIESWVRVPVEVEVASEFNYRDVLVTSHTLCVIITQSGETADTLMAARKMHDAGAKVFAITNVLGSTAARESDGTLYIHAGPEVSVASTKAYTSQIVAMALLALFLAERKGTLDRAGIDERFACLEKLPDAIRDVIARQDEAAAAAEDFRFARSALFLGRGFNSATAHEGALKLKEISYLHAEAYPAGEMKHGPIALLEPGFPVMMIVPDDGVRSKTISNIAEVRARGASVVAVATKGDDEVGGLCSHVMWIPPLPEWCNPIVAVVFLQLFARCVAISRSCNVDRPRNLAKSVTVE